MVCKDPGGMAGIVPVAEQLRRRRGDDVALIANGRAVGLLQEQGQKPGVDFLAPASAQEVLTVFSRPSLLVTSMCNDGGIGRNLVPLCRELCCPSVALCDTWSSGTLWGEWADLQYRPDWMLGNDPLNRALVRKAWPDFPENQFVTTGFPAFDRFVGIDRKAIEAKVRDRFGIPADQPIIVHAGELDMSAHALGVVVEALNRITPRACLITRMHPRMSQAPGELQPWQAALERYGGRVIADSSALFTTLEVTATATVVTSMSSTVLAEAGLLRKPNVSVFTPPVQEAYLEWSHGLTQEPLTVTLGCTARANSAGELTHLIEEAFSGALGARLRPFQEQHLRADGRNAERAADFLESLL
ncbi:MAG: hypothetical protein HYV77_03490 [Candidatus Wildermuthbacteria bacterium]|nr:hypothetical protein [Candidatus Wildermuthbacteria bacterium]